MRATVILIFILFLAFSLVAQSKEPRLIDEFAVVPCGDMMARLDSLWAEWRNDKAERIVVVFYGRRFARTVERRNGREVLVLLPTHPEDGLNWAKGIPKYLIARHRSAWDEEVSVLEQQIQLIDGGFREDLSAELWLVPPGAADPSPTPTIKRSDIKFGAKRPRHVPDYSNCYGGY